MQIQWLTTKIGLKFKPLLFRLYLDRIQTTPPSIIGLNIQACYIQRSQYAFQACRRETINTTTMAAAPVNGPLPPHMKSNFRRIHIRLIGDNAPSKRICFSLAVSQSKALKTLQFCGNDGDESCLAIGAFLGLQTGSLLEKSIFACSGHSPPSIKHVIAGFSTFQVALGGHFWRRRPW